MATQISQVVEANQYGKVVFLSPNTNDFRVSFAVYAVNETGAGFDPVNFNLYATLRKLDNAEMQTQLPLPDWTGVSSDGAPVFGNIFFPAQAIQIENVGTGPLRFDVLQGGAL